MRNNPDIVNAMATNKAHALYASSDDEAMPGNPGKKLLDRLDYLTPLVSPTLGEQGGAPLGEAVSSNYTPEG